MAHLEDGVIASKVARSQCVGDVDRDIEGRSVLAGLAAAGWEQAEDRFEASVARRVVIAINVVGGRLPTARTGQMLGSRSLLPSGSFSVETVKRFFNKRLSTNCHTLVPSGSQQAVGDLPVGICGVHDKDVQVS